MWTLAGPIAERRSGLSLTESPLAFQEQTHDEQARDVLAAHHGVWPDSHIVTVELGQDRYRTERIVDRRWAWIKRVAERLTEDVQLSGEQVQRLFVVSIR
jgi:hypothetical protein